MRRLIGKLRTRHNRWNSQPIELSTEGLAATTMPSSSPVDVEVPGGVKASATRMMQPP